MRNLLSKRLLHVLSLTVLVIGTQQFADAANTFVWNVVTPGANAWNVAGNWNPNGVAGLADTNIFGPVGTSANATTVNNVVSASTTISTLQYTNLAAAGTAFHVTQIPAGVTLTVSSNLTVGSSTPTDAVATYAAMADAGTLLVNAPALNVADVGSGASTALATLDLSGLSNFVYNSSSGTINVEGGTVTRVGGVLILAGFSNNVTAGTINFGTGSGAQAGNGSSAFKFGGGTNNINVGNLNIVNNKNSGTVSFLGATGGLRLRGVGGTDADRATITIGNRNQTGTGTTTGNLSLNGHPVDIKAGTMILGTDLVSGGNAAVGTLSFNQGTVDATIVNLGAAGNAAVLGATGTISVGTAGTLIVNSMSMVNQTAGIGTGNLIVTNGGALICSNGIVKTTTAGTANIIFSSASVNLMGGTIGTTVSPIDNFSITNTTLILGVGVNNTPTNIVVSTLNVGAATSTINISSLPVIGVYPTQLKLIKFTTANGTPAAFTLGTLPGTFLGYISNNVGISIDLVITNGPVPPLASKAVVWDGEVSGAWDTTTTNWSNAGNLTNYNDVTASGFGDTVTFDDSLLGTTNVNLTQTLSPGSISVSSTTNYFFTGSGKISGAISLTKSGSSTLTFANSAANDFSGPITLNAGMLAYDQTVDATVANAISGVGTVIKNNVNTLTLSGASGFSGGLTLNGGVTRGTTIGGSGAGLITVNSGATFVAGALHTNSITLNNGTLGVATADFIMATNKELTIAANSTNILIATDPQAPTTSRNIEVDANLRGSGTIIIQNANGITSPDGNQGARFRNTNAVSDFSGTIIVTNNSKSELLVQSAGPYSPVGTGKFILYAGLYDGGNTLTAPATGGYLEFNYRNSGGSTMIGNDFTIAGSGAVVINGLGSPNGAVATNGNLKIGGGQELIGYRGAGTTTNSAAFTTVTLTGGNATFSPHSATFGAANQAGTDFILGNIGEQVPGSGIIMAGLGNLTLIGANNYSGDTVVNRGVLSLNGSASIATSPNIIVAGGARFDVTTHAPAFALGAAQTLSNSTSTAVISGNTDASVGIVSLTYAASTPSFNITNGVLTLASGTAVKVNNTGTALARGSYKIISAASTGSAGSVAGAAPSSVAVGGNGLATAVTPSLQITGNELFLVVPDAAPVIANIVTNSTTAGVTWKIAISNLTTAAGWSDADNDALTLSSVGPLSNLGNSVTQDGTFVYYNAPVTAEDFFSYTISDGTLTANGTVYLEAVTATPPAPATATQIITDGNGVPTITFASIPGRTNVVEASTNLIDWSAISTNVAGGNGLWQVTDLDATNFVNRYYRSYQPNP